MCVLVPRCHPSQLGSLEGPRLEFLWLWETTKNSKLSNYACMCAESLQSCLTLCNPMDCSLPGSSTHRILQARIWECVVKLSSRGSSPPRDRTCISYISCTGRPVLYHQHHLGSPRNYNPINRKESKTSQLCPKSVVMRHCMLMRWRSDMGRFCLNSEEILLQISLGISNLYILFCLFVLTPVFTSFCPTSHIDQSLDLPTFYHQRGHWK